MTNSLLFPLAAHVGLTALLYAWLTVTRMPSVWGLGGRPDGSNPWINVERRVSANLTNQFEWPLFFHAACLILLQREANDPVQLWLAWTFVAGRYAHSVVQTLTDNVRLRGVVFTINFAAVLAMWLRLVLAQINSAA